MDKKYQKLVKNSAVLMIANFGSKLLSFILVPFYTHVLATGEYGTVDTLVATVSLLSPIATFGIGDVMVMYLSKKEYAAKKIFTNAILLIVFGNILVSFIYPLLYFSDIFKSYVFYFCLLVVISSVYGVLQMYAKGTEKVTACAVSGIIYTITLALSNIVLLLLLKQGVKGYLLSTILAYLVPTLYLFVTVRDKCFKLELIDKQLIQGILRLSIPLIPTSILWTLMNLADKYSILWFVGSSGNGIYAVAHKIPTIIGVIYSIFQQAWQLTTFELDNKAERSKAYSKIFEMLTCIMFCTGTSLMIVNKLYISYLCDASYISAWKISPILMFGSLLNCLSGFLGSNYLIMHNTKSALKVTAVGALINVMYNFTLVPIAGLFGASVATCLGYVYMVLKKFRDTSEFTPLSINVKRFACAVILMIFSCISVLVSSDYLYYMVNIIIALTTIFMYRDQFTSVLKVILLKGKKR